MSYRILPAGLTLLLLAILAVPGRAQGRPAGWAGHGALVHAPPQGPPMLHPKTQRMVSAGVAGGAVGLIAGGFLGFSLEMAAAGCTDDYLCGVMGTLLGGVIGEAVLLPVGVHLAAGGDGDLRRSVLYSAGIAAAGLLLTGGTAAVSPELALVVLAGIPVVQLAASIGEERSGRRRTRRTTPETTLSR